MAEEERLGDNSGRRSDDDLIASLGQNKNVMHHLRELESKDDEHLIRRLDAENAGSS